ncbi:MAG: hypothetical protein WCT36_03410, partial [Candidatus Gracilibacteria bacterium]
MGNKPHRGPGKAPRERAETHQGHSKIKLALSLLTATISAIALGAIDNNPHQVAEDTHQNTLATAPVLTPAPAPVKLTPEVGRASDAEENLDTLIGKIETAVTILQAKFDFSKIKSEEMKSMLKRVFNIIELNKSNDTRNQLKRARIKRTGEHALFFYKMDDTVLTRARALAAYAQLDEIVYLNPSFDPDNLYDLALFIHEIKHALSDSDRRGDLTPDEKKKYIEFLMPKEGEKMKCEIYEEAQ